MASATETGAVISHISFDAIQRMVCRLAWSFYIRVLTLTYFVARVTPHQGGSWRRRGQPQTRILYGALLVVQPFQQRDVLRTQMILISGDIPGCIAFDLPHVRKMIPIGFALAVKTAHGHRDGNFTTTSAARLVTNSFLFAKLKAL
jgi:hypothetical protein